MIRKIWEAVQEKKVKTLKVGLAPVRESCRSERYRSISVSQGQSGPVPFRHEDTACCHMIGKQCGFDRILHIGRSWFRSVRCGS